jgi:hypothetical protein
VNNYKSSETYFLKREASRATTHLSLAASASTNCRRKKSYFNRFSKKYLKICKQNDLQNNGKQNKRRKRRKRKKKKEKKLLTRNIFVISS